MMIPTRILHALETGLFFFFLETEHTEGVM